MRAISSLPSNGADAYAALHEWLLAVVLAVAIQPRLTSEAPLLAQPAGRCGGLYRRTMAV
ncbi:hypothetical protein C5L38_34225 (plasmid) [Streptomyces sp. WAC00288]|nr:hypothetical protein C5L38_34225 [Streptomyces sp. WAC00288]KYG51184.1 hypothetical protein AWI43_32640 [Streptomyces sp. WAC04657]